MLFNDHSKLIGQHAFLSASKYYWLNYDEDTLRNSLINYYAAPIGTAVHDYAQQRIKNKLKVNSIRSEKNALINYLVSPPYNIPRFAINLNNFFGAYKEYVNDAIGFLMAPEIVLYYSDVCFGTADALYYGPFGDGEHTILRIHDLKTGRQQAHIEQLMIYAALFCLEYMPLIKNDNVLFELRIYQDDEIRIHNPLLEDIKSISDTIRNDVNIVSNILELEE